MLHLIFIVSTLMNALVSLTVMSASCDASTNDCTEVIDWYWYWWLDIAPLLNAGHLWKALYSCFSARPLLHTVSFHVEGEPTPPRSTPWGAYRSAISCEAVPLHLAFHSSTPHSLTLDRSTVVGHIPTDHTCSFECTNHIDMTVHNPAFLWVR